MPESSLDGSITYSVYYTFKINDYLPEYKGTQSIKDLSQISRLKVTKEKENNMNVMK
jgi:hypothetical protein